MIVAELFAPKLCTVNSITDYAGNNGIGGFFCTVAGTITLTDAVTGNTWINAMAVTAGIWYPLPFTIPVGQFTTAGGAAGILGLD